MKFSLDYIYSHLMYDLVVDGLTYHGNIDYVSSHFGDGNNIKMSISNSQEETLSEFVKEYLSILKNEPSLTIEEFYNRKAI